MKLRREIGLDLETARKAGCYFGWIAASLDVSAAFGGLMQRGFYCRGFQSLLGGALSLDLTVSVKYSKTFANKIKYHMRR